MAAAEDFGSKVLVLMIPDGAQIHDYQRQHINRFLKLECMKMNVPFIDATHNFESEEDIDSLYLFPNDAHTSPKGHRIIAEMLAKEVPMLLHRQ